MSYTQVIIPWLPENSKNIEYLREELKRLRAKGWPVRTYSRRNDGIKKRRQIKLVRFIYD